MSYANPLMLFGLAGVLIPIIIHLITQHRAKRVDWGAMLFLQESVVHRSRRMLLEQILLLMTRCLLVGLVAMALALPFVRPESRIPWPFVLPAVLLGTAALGAGAALSQYRAWRWIMFVLGAVLLLSPIAAVLIAQSFGGLSLQPAGAQDVVIVIDGSDSMNLAIDGVTNFQTAQTEAEGIVAAMRPGDAATVIVAGAETQTSPPSPSRRVDELKEVIAGLSAPGGLMSAGDALAAAAAACQRGDNVSKKIVIITDGQSAGWAAEGRVNWEQLAQPLKKLPVAPSIILRRLPLPKRINNAQITDIAVAQGVVAPDREQGVEVRVENTGTEPINEAFDVELSLNNSPQPMRQSVAKLQPGVAESLTFHIQPERGGLHSLSARVVRPDDLLWDNSASRVVRAFERVPILMVDGNPTGRIQDRATWYLDLALAPDFDERVKPAPRKGAGAAEELAHSGLYRVTTVELSKVGNVDDLRQYRVVVLADVPKLPTKTAVALADFVADGGGLLISLGSRCQKDFYNNWQARGAPLMPAPLVDRRVATNTQPAVHPLVGSFQHDALRLVGGNAKSDMGAATVTAYWQLKAAAGDTGAQTCAALSSGDPWLMERRIGRGRVIVSSVALDRTGSDLPSLQSFAPLVFEIVSHLTQLPAGGTEISLAGKQSVDVRTLRNSLPGSAGKLAAEATLAASTSAGAGTTASGQGLLGEYYSGSDFKRRLRSRVDPTIAFQWPATPIEGLTDPAFSVRWIGTLVPTTTDTYTFTLEGEQTKLWINGKLVAASAPPPAPPKPAAPGAPPPAAPPAAPQPAVSQPLELVGGQPYAIRVEHVGRAGQGKCELHWQGKQLVRQVIPAACLSPTSAWRAELARSANDDAPATLPGVLIGAAGAQHAAAIAGRDDGVTAYIKDKLKPGLYRLQLPDTMRDDFQEVLVDDSLPVAVRSEPRESQLAVLSDADLAAAAGQVSLASAGSVEDVVGQLSGRGPSQRLWRYLAIGALLFAVAEIALARWIAVQRMIGHEPQVAFAVETLRPSPFSRMMASAPNRDAALASRGRKPTEESAH